MFISTGAFYLYPKKSIVSKDIEASVGMALFDPIYTNEGDGPGAGGGKP
ncbi:MAG: hypothetical protein R3A45_08550 [Bdellovibrionota bacterium]